MKRPVELDPPPRWMRNLPRGALRRTSVLEAFIKANSLPRPTLADLEAERQRRRA